MAADRTIEARQHVRAFVEWMVLENMQLDGWAAFSYAKKCKPERSNHYHRELGAALLRLAQDEYGVALRADIDEDEPLSGSW